MRRRDRQEGGGLKDPGWPKFRLSEAAEEGPYEVVSVGGPAKPRLEALGLVRGAAVSVEGRGPAGLVLSVLGSRVALSPDAASDVTVAWRPDPPGGHAFSGETGAAAPVQ